MEPLGRFRSHIAGGTWLAFFALACQLILTFGHTHFDNGGVTGSASPAIPLPEVSSSTAAPAKRPPQGLAQDFCAVCSNLALAQTLVLPASPRWVTPVAISASLPLVIAAVAVASKDRLHFRARGPPVPGPAI